jgi:hypothetical protein
VEAAGSLAEEIRDFSGNASAIKEEEIREAALDVGLIVNCSTKGQGGIRKGPDGRITSLEPYSALGLANPATFPESKYSGPEFYRAWLSASLADIEANNRASLDLVRSVPCHVGFCDLIYFPTETVFLRHGRWSGHRTLNGKGMNVAQAADAFFHKVCQQYLKKVGLCNLETYRRVFDVMWEAW